MKEKNMKPGFGTILMLMKSYGKIFKTRPQAKMMDVPPQAVTKTQFYMKTISTKLFH